MTNFHISIDGIARQCHAQSPESCTATSSDQKEHFDTKKEAQISYEKSQENKGNGIFSFKKNNRQSKRKTNTMNRKEAHDNAIKIIQASNDFFPRIYENPGVSLSDIDNLGKLLQETLKNKDLIEPKLFSNMIAGSRLVLYTGYGQSIEKLKKEKKRTILNAKKRKEIDTLIDVIDKKRSQYKD